MKKITKTLVAIACVATLGAGVGAMSACDNGKTGEAYGLSHGAGYVAYASVTVKGDKITDATLTEVCLPTYVTAAASVADADKVTVTVTDHGEEVEKSFYKTISFGGVTFTYDATAKEYKNDTQSLLKYLETEANCKTYYEAVTSNNLIVKIGTDDKKDIMTKANLSKEENGYWTRGKNTDGKWNSASDTYSADKYSRWKWNRDATVAYVIANGVDGLKTLTKSTKDEDKVEDNTNEKKQVTYWKDSNGVSTGATWSDMYKAEAPTGYLTYAQLLIKANDAAK